VTHRTAATRYARALLDIATKEQADLSSVESDLAGFVALFDATPTLSKALLNPVVPAGRKRATVEALVARAALVPVVGKLLVLLADRDRFALLHTVLDIYRERLMEQRHIIRARVTTATPMPAAQAKSIEESLARATGRTVVLSADVDPAIVGGLVARVGSTVYDGSVTHQLQRLKQRLEESI
jgi:F-type H+-transporting ATPase subunit delta